MRFMKKEKLMQIIDDTIKSIWAEEIKDDYECGWLLKEDTLKNSIYHHLRSKLGCLFVENDIRIFTEFTDGKFTGTDFRPDLVVAHVDFEQEKEFYGDYVSECLCVIEIKYKRGYGASKDIYDDYKKLRTYAEDLDVDCKLYMATIWEYEDDETYWEEEDSTWAKGILTELNASYKRETTDMRFYIRKH